MKPPFARSLGAGAALVAALTLTSCSLLGGGAVPQDELEKGVASELNEQSGQDNSASCDGDLEAEEDATQECTWEGPGGEEIPVKVTATEVKDDDVEYSIEPQSPDSGDSAGAGDSGDSDAEGASDDSQAGSPVKQEVLEQEVREQIRKQTKKSFPVSCKGDLEGEEGATQRCVWNADDGSTLGIDVTLTGYSDGKANFDIKADDDATPAPSGS